MTTTIKPVKDMNTDELVAFLHELNAAYRKGEPLVEDDTYDHVYLAELKHRDPDHEFLQLVEPEAATKGKKVRHTIPMLSTEKAYEQDEINAFIKRVIKAAEEADIAEDDIKFRITAKLDGMAGKYENDILATRGNGLLGNDVTHNIKRGVLCIGGENSGVGEIVISKQYFEENLSEQFSHPRNFVTGVIGSDTLNDLAVKALQDQAIHFVAYSALESVSCNVEQLSTQIETLCDQVEQACVYPLDGCVIDVMNLPLRDIMGATNHHNNWQIAKKRKGESASAKVLGITWQTGRTGRITPVINIETTNLSGANISNITGHHAGNIKNLNVGIGATIEFVRSGEVIPKLLGVIETGEKAIIPATCPACDAETGFDNDFLICTGDNCVAQAESRLTHFFNILGNVDLFGPRTINTLVQSGITELETLYALTAVEFREMGFGDKQAENLEAQLLRSRTEEVEDWRFLAAFGVHHLGRGDSRKILEVHAIESINTLTSENLLEIAGFGQITSEDIPKGIQKRWSSISALLALGFNLRSDQVEVTESAITGKHIVFTGSMSSSRDGMKEQARQLGANVQSSVNKKTDMLVIGEKVGASKITKAESLGTQVVTEAEYLALIA